MTTVNAPRTAQLAVQRTLVADGATVSAVTFSSPTWGFAVATGRHEETLELALDPHQTSIELLAIVENYVRRHRAILATPGHYVGTWLHDGKIYLDVSQVIYDRDDAVRAGKDRDQIAIFDLRHAEEITLRQD